MTKPGWIPDWWKWPAAVLAAAALWGTLLGACEHGLEVWRHPFDVQPFHTEVNRHQEFTEQAAKVLLHDRRFDRCRQAKLAEGYGREQALALCEHEVGPAPAEPEEIHE